MPVLTVGQYDTLLNVTGMAVKPGDLVRIEIDPAQYGRRTEQYEI